MRRQLAWWLIVLAGTGCSSPWIRPGLAPVGVHESATTRPAEPVLPAAALPNGIEIRLHDRTAMTLRGAVELEPGKAAYQLYAVEMTPETAPADDTTSQPAGRRESFLLRAKQAASVIHCDIIYSLDESAATVLLRSDRELPAIRLIGATPARMLPICLRQAYASESFSDHAIRSAIGLPADGAANGLFNPVEDYALAIEGLVEYRFAQDGTVVSATLPEPRAATQPILVLRGSRDHLRRLANLPEYSMLNRQQFPSAPAGWSGCRQGDSLAGERLIQIDRWMENNLALFGASYISATVFGNTRMQLTSCREDGVADLPECRPLGSPIMPGSLSGYSPAEPDYLLLKRILSVCDAVSLDYPLQGHAAYCDPGPVHLDEPLSLGRARLWASLMGLGGMALMAGDELDTLADERVELYRRICPPAPIHAMDLFERSGGARPWLWDLKVERDFARWDVLGVLNWWVQPTSRTVTLSQLGLPTDEHRSYAIYDFWEQKLVAVTGDEFQVYLDPTSARVFSVRPLRADGPTLISTSRHVTQGAIELRALQYDPKTLTLTGTSDLVADDPYEIRLFVPEAAKSYEVVEVQADVIAAHVRLDGPVRIVTLETDRNGAVDWSIRFKEASHSFRHPLSPDRLIAQQNTRGVRLEWNAPTHRPVRYRIYRNDKPVADVAGRCHEYQDSQVVYNERYVYAVTSVDWAGRQSEPTRTAHRTPIPGDAYLTQLVPISILGEQPMIRLNESIGRRTLRMAGRRYHRGLGTFAGSRVSYFLGSGYERFSGEVGIDDETRGKGQAKFKIYGDTDLLFESALLRSGQRPQRFDVSVADKRLLTLVAENPDGPGPEDHADWGDAYLHAARFAAESRPVR